jgi:hypothetical protein
MWRGDHRSGVAPWLSADDVTAEGKSGTNMRIVSVVVLLAE